MESVTFRGRLTGWDDVRVPVGVRLRVVVRGVSPLIVRTIGAPACVSLVQLHHVLLGERHIPWEVDETGMMVGCRSVSGCGFVVREISPLIVRTIGVPGGVSLVELHCMLLACSAGRASISTCSGLRSFLLRLGLHRR